MEREGGVRERERKRESGRVGERGSESQRKRGNRRGLHKSRFF